MQAKESDKVIAIHSSATTNLANRMKQLERMKESIQTGAFTELQNNLNENTLFFDDYGCLIIPIDDTKPVKGHKNKVDCDISDMFHPMFLAIKYNRLDILKWLIEVKKYPLFRSCWYEREDGTTKIDTFLRVVFYFSHLEMLMWVVDNVDKEKIKDTNLPDSIAFKIDSPPLLQKLLEKNYIKLNERRVFHPCRNKNPLFITLEYGNLANLKWLINEQGFRASIESHTYNNNLLHWALQNAHFNSVKWLVEEQGYSLTDAPILLWACANDSLDLVKWLIEEKNAVLEVCDEAGRNPLIKAVSNGRLSIAQYLVHEKQCALTIKSTSNETHLIHYAALNNDIEMLKWLLEEGCNWEQTNMHGYTILNMLFDNCNAECHEWLYKEKSIYKEKWARQIALDSMPWNYMQDALPHIIKYVANEVELNAWLQKLDNAYDRLFLVEKRNATYENVINQLQQQANPYYKLVLNHFADINVASLKHIELLLADESNLKAVQCIEKLLNDSHVSPEIINESRLSLAEMLFADVANLQESGSPLNQNNELLTQNNYLIKRVLQSYYLIENCVFVDAYKQEILNRFKKRLAAICERDDSLQTENKALACNINTWKKEIQFTYKRYCYYKQPNVTCELYNSKAGFLFYSTKNPIDAPAITQKTTQRRSWG